MTAIPHPLAGAAHAHDDAHAHGHEELGFLKKYIFSADHKIHCVTKPGQPHLEGDGIWMLNRDGVFSFWITHPDPNGEINASHLGRVERNRFATKATAYIYSPAGAAIIGPVQVESKAKRA